MMRLFAGSVTVGMLRQGSKMFGFLGNDLATQSSMHITACMDVGGTALARLAGELVPF